YGRISVAGVLPLAPSLDHVGVMANCVRDLAYMFEVLAAPGKDCVGLIDAGPQGIEPRPLGGYFDSTDLDLLEEYRDCLHHLECSDNVLTLPPEFARIPDAHLTTMSVEAAGFHAGRLRRTP